MCSGTPSHSFSLLFCHLLQTTTTPVPVPANGTPTRHPARVVEESISAQEGTALYVSNHGIPAANGRIVDSNGSLVNRVRRHRRVDPSHINEMAEHLPTLPGEEFVEFDQRVLPDQRTLPRGLYFISNIGRLIRATMNRAGELAVFFYRRSFTGDGYAQYSLPAFDTNTTETSGYTFRAHRAVAYSFFGPPPEGRPHVDHSNRNRSYNAIWNLAWVSLSVNMHNTGSRGDNTSGVRGVSYSSAKNRWVAALTVRGRTYKEYFACDSRGRGDTTAFDAAVQARRNMEQMYR